MKLTQRFTMIFLVAMLSLVAGSCRKRYINGDLDGQWQVMSIETADGEVKYPNQVYYCLFRHTFNLRGIGLPTIAGNMVYEGDMLKLEAPYSKDADLLPWGMNKSVTTFDIIYLSGKNMTLQSDFSTITFRKF